MGQSAANETNLREEGNPHREQIALGFIIYTNQIYVRLHDVAIDESRVLTQAVLDMFGAKLVTIYMLQQLRGNSEHFRSANVM